MIDTYLSRVPALDVNTSMLLTYLSKGVGSNYPLFVCKHFNVIDLSCEAFPNGIPTKVLTGETVHNKVIAGQYGKVIREKRGKQSSSPL